MQERLATVGQLAAGIAHDFNNIMAAILVYADLLRSDPELSPVAQNQLGIIQQQVHRASSLIRQILDFSRRSIMEPSTFDLLPFVKEMEKMLRRVIPETINLRLSYLPGAYLIQGDPSRLQQALMNLALNARDAMQDGGDLVFELGKLELKPEDDPPLPDMQCGAWVRVAVSDTGVGISPENLPHIFEPFFTTKPVGQGTGLGLAQVYGIIKQHNGLIEVHTQLKAGTTFTIYLPAQQAAEESGSTKEIPVRLDGAGKRVLVVEDDQATLTAIQTLLEADNYQVLTASNGKDALQMINKGVGSIELVVSDLVMPQMGGLALYQEISESWPKAKMLFVTGHPMEGENQILLERGNVSWLQKPFSIQQFNKAVRALVESDRVTPL
jgi:CheY-like chemotaxis protein